jgi:hypothetical protein
MSDLARRRSARDLWISRSHVLLGAVGVVLLSLGSFSLGVLHGRAGDAGVKVVSTSLSTELPNGSLVELLARVEATADAGGEVEVLTFPDALTNSPAGSSVEVGPRPEGRFSIEVARFEDVGRARPLRDVLREAGHKAWVAVELVGGEMHYRVVVGGFAGHSGAESALAVVSESLNTVTGGPYTPVIIGR